ncbi:PLP-dependent aminotransferase family protein [Nocardioides sp. CFH 31398]|uniref:MocR-like transcription factor YczR n=1 Tax=Nocardioides sp. CFH 31398 TaxID=2919579 RepID=UPI001F056C03|nr:PLP-dependent aminotransferase family protein [Nocardioides sp. CFH 31398]MCH1867872.1 PLP-dependent aminotransferase family protein [Nocardioides sp. CFH 31398]
MARTVHAARLASLLGDFGRDPAYAGLADGVRALVDEGRVPTGTRLPSERDLVAALGVSRTTVARAYAALRDSGYLVSRQGSGSVAQLPPGRGHRGDHLLSPGVDPDGPEGTGTGDVVDLTCAAPAPPPEVHEAYRRGVEALPAHLGGTGYYPSGMAVLRQAVAEGYARRGLPTDPGQVVVVAGAQAGVALTARSLLGPGDRVVVESPTYPNAIATLARAGGRVLGSDVLDDGSDTDGLATTLRQVLPRVAYLIPDFHNPTGVLRDDAARERVAATLRRTGTTAIVDESMVALPLEGQAMPLPFAAHAPDTISVGSISKPYWGGLRVGWLRLPESRLAGVLAERLALDLGAPVLEQLVSADLLAAGDGLLGARREGLRAARDAALAAIATHLPDWTLTPPGGGLCLWCRLPAPLSTALTVRAREHGVLLAPGPAFAPEGGLDRYVRLPFTQTPAVMTDAVERLATAWAETLADPAPGAGVGRAPSPVLVA